MRVEAAAAQRVGERIAAVGGRLRDADHSRERDALAEPLDAREHRLAGDRARHQHDLAVLARDHPAAGCRLLDLQPELVADSEAHASMTYAEGLRVRLKPGTTAEA